MLWVSSATGTNSCTNGWMVVLHCDDATVSPDELVIVIVTVPTGSLKVKLSSRDRVLIWASIVGSDFFQYQNLNQTTLRHRYLYQYPE